jgi:hypothetical protein
VVWFARITFLASYARTTNTLTGVGITSVVDGTHRIAFTRLTALSTGYVEMTGFALVTVYSSHVWFTLALTGQLIARQRSESRLGGAEMETIARFAIAFFGSKSVSEVSR